MKKRTITFLGAMASVVIFSCAAMAENDSTAVTNVNQLTTKNYVDRGLRAVYDVASEAADAADAAAVAANAAAVTANTNAQNIGALNQLNIAVDDGNGGTTTPGNLVDAINAVADIAADAVDAQTAYTADDGVTIDNNVIKLNGVADDDKMYVYKNGEFVDVPVVDSWVNDTLNQ